MPSRLNWLVVQALPVTALTLRSRPLHHTRARMAASSTALIEVERKFEASLGADELTAAVE